MDTIIPGSLISNGEAVAVDGGTAGHTMTLLSESLREAQRPTRSLATPNSTVHVGGWKVRTMYTAGKAPQVARQMERCRLDIYGKSKMRRTAAGRIKMTDGYSVIFAREESEHQRGVAMMTSQKTQKSLTEWTAVSSRIISERFYSLSKKTTVTLVYAPTKEAADDEKDEFYDQTNFRQKSISATDM